MNPFFDTEAEQAALALALVSPKECFDGLTPQHFGGEIERRAFVALQSIYMGGDVPAVNHVTDEDARSLLDSMVLLDIRPLGIQTLRPRLEACRVRRLAHEKADRIMRMAMDGAEPELLETAFLNTNLRGNTASGGTRAADAMDVLEDFELRCNNPGTILGVSSGIQEWDEILDGFIPGYHIIAGRPSMGKTALLTQVLVDMALDGVPVLLLSLEMSAKQIRSRIVSQLTGVPVGGYREHGYTADDCRRIAEGFKQIKQLPHFHIVDPAGDNVKDWPVCRRLIQRYVKEYGVAAAGIDYVQLLTNSAERDSQRVNELGKISGEIKEVSMVANIPLLVAAQLRRPTVEHSTPSRPDLSSLKDCGSLEQDCDTATFIHDDSLNVEKNRHGRTGDIPVELRPDYMRFDATSPMERRLKKSR
jgi:replicative DNA helicase